MHVLSAGTARARFVVVEWSGQPGLGQPFPSGVMALSDVVTLHPGMNNFNKNLAVDFRLAPNGFESWSDLALTLLDPMAPIPAQLGGAHATTGLLLDNGKPLTQVTPELTVPPHSLVISGFPPGTLLVSGDVRNTTGRTPPPTPTPTPHTAPPKLTLPANRADHAAALNADR